jgi:hypothetical protein
MSGAQQGVGLAQRLGALQDMLLRHEALWRPHAFQHPRLPWEAGFPALAARLRALDCERAETLAEDDAALVALLSADLAELPEAIGVPGRKWLQVQAFAACVPSRPGPLLEWCAGKAHLGRLLARLQQRTVHALEWSGELIASGAALAQRERLPVQFHCIDALQPAAGELLRRDGDVVALHACGDLHLQLLRHCAQRRPQVLVLAPCCYQLIAAGRYEPLSRAAQRGDLRLDRHDLHTAVRDSVTSPQRVLAQRRQLSAWRLGFDAWQRAARSADDYLPMPSQSFAVLRGSFADFCRALAAHHGIAVDGSPDIAPFEAEGWRRHREVAALDLARIAFRRPLEVWLALDRALFLEEHGYAVELGTFCARELTPRNILLRARRRELLRARRREPAGPAG